MTTAHRPTWAPAKGGEEQGGVRAFGPSRQYSSRDAPSHTVLKERGATQGSQKELKERDLKAELEDRERQHQKKRTREEAEELRAIEAPPAKVGGGGERREGSEHRLVPKAVDADDSDGGDSDDDDDDDEDDEAELLAELERIKKERAEEASRKQAEEEKEAEEAKAAEMAFGNPLTAKAAATQGFSVKRRWDDDVVFKNQSRNEPKEKVRFINDTIRSDFHRRFLNKYMK